MGQRCIFIYFLHLNYRSGTPTFIHQKSIIMIGYEITMLPAMLPRKITQKSADMSHYSLVQVTQTITFHANFYRHTHFNFQLTFHVCK